MVNPIVIAKATKKVASARTSARRARGTARARRGYSGQVSKIRPRVRSNTNRLRRTGQVFSRFLPQGREKGIIVSTPPESYRVSMPVAFLMLVIAIFLDGVQGFTKILYVVPVLGPLVALLSGWTTTIIGYGVFMLWFKISGVTFMSGERLLSKLLITFGSMTIEAIPLINALPALTLFVFFTIVFVRLEDALYNRKMQNVEVRRYA